MKKNILIKGILVLIAIAIFALVFVGCVPAPTPPAITGTVYIYIYGTYWYDIYMDNMLQFWTASPYYTYIIYNVPTGYHYFEAIDIDGAWWGYDSVTQYIYSGANYVYLWP